MVSDTNGIKPIKQNSKTTNRINNNTESEKKRVPWFKRPTTEKIIATATVVISVMTILQWCAINRTDQTSRLRDRAYVYFSNPITTPYPQDKPEVLAIGINIVNTGNMPAGNISIRCGYTASLAPNNIVDPFPLAKWSVVQSPESVGPKQGSLLQGCEIPFGTIKQAQKNEVNIFVLMEVKYTDGFDPQKTRITQMSRSLRFDKHGSYSWGFTAPHNCIDDDCN